MAELSQQVIWTALPNGTNGETLDVSVVVSPRLNVDGGTVAQLSRFPVWMDWPGILRKAEFKVVFNGNETEAQLVSRPESEIWRAIFTKTTRVEDHLFEDLSERSMVSYPFGDLAKRIRDIFTDIVSRHPESLPKGAELEQLLNPLVLAPYGPDVLKQIAEKGGKNYLRELEKAGYADLGLFHAYHAPFRVDAADPAVPEDASALEAGIDFHKLVSMLGQYRRLLRDTGLVLDLKIKNDFQPGKGPLSVRVDWNPGRGVTTFKDVQPETMTQLDKTRFEAVPKNSPMAGRRLDLSKERFSVEQIDIDGAVLKLTGTGASLQARAENARQNNGETGKTRKDDEPTGLPTLRSAGIIVAERGRGEGLADRLARATGFDAALEQQSDILLHAEDVMRGLHVDVEQSGQWYSLCRTDVHYDFTKFSISFQDKNCEGIVQLGVTEAGPNASGELASVVKLHEGLFNWDGWSLAAPRPGLALDASGVPGREEGSADLPISVTTQVHPGSLPTLRYGASYRFRARAVDLAYNAEHLKKGGKGGETPLVTFYRFEPLAPPLTALIRDPAPNNRTFVRTPALGESLTRIVIRSFDADMAQPSSDVSERILFPPRVSAEMSERHGMLDGPDHRPMPGKYATLTGQDADLEAHEGGTVNSPMTYPVADRGTVKAPYLPDPAATELRADMRSVPKRPTTGGRSRNDVHVKVPWGPEWPDHAPIVLRLHEDAADALSFVPDQQSVFDIESRAVLDETTRTLSVALPKGETVEVELGHSFPGKPDPADIWGIAAWLKQAMGPDQYEQAMNAINAGKYWAITPKARLELVHATQRPLVTPDPVISVAARIAGVTTADLALSSPLHAESSADVTLEGRWNEPVDAGMGSISTVRKSGRVMRETLEPHRTPHGTLSLDAVHQFGDTKYRRVNYQLSASSRFTEYFPPGISNDRNMMSVRSREVVAYVQNAAPPPPPSVASAIPIFDWLRNNTGTRQASFRRSGVRVYLDRPWFATGFGEMLAAVVPRQQDHGGADGLNPILAEHVSRWGADPIWRRENGGKVTDPSPDIDHFPTRATPQDSADDRWPDLVPEEDRDLPGNLERYQNLSLPGESGETVAVVDAAGHPVSWNAEEARFYSDLMMKSDRVYQPFVSLAVARLHPVSAEKCHLSPSVRLPTMQILPARLVRARKLSTGWSIQIYGHRHLNTNAETDRPLQSVIRAEVQRTAANSPDELDWETIDDANIAMEPIQFLVSSTSTTVVSGNLLASTLFAGQAGELRDAAQEFLSEVPRRLFTRLIKAPGAGGGNRGSYRWRIHLSEWERHAADLGTPAVLQVPGENERLVFAEQFEI